MSLEDVMSTSWEDLMAILESTEKKKEEEIEDFSEFFM